MKWEVLQYLSDTVLHYTVALEAIANYEDKPEGVMTTRIDPKQVASDTLRIRREIAEQIPNVADIIKEVASLEEDLERIKVAYQDREEDIKSLQKGLKLNEFFEFINSKDELNREILRTLEYYADPYNHVVANAMAVSKTEMERDKGSRAQELLSKLKSKGADV